MALVGLAAIVVLALGPFRGAISDAVSSIKEHFSAGHELHPHAYVGNQEVNDLVDNRLDTSWTEAGGTGGNVALTFKFDTPVSLDHIIVTSGKHGTPSQYLENAVPQDVDVVAEPSGASATLHLKQTGDPQKQEFSASNVTQVTLLVRSRINSNLGGPNGDKLAVDEVEFIGD